MIDTDARNVKSNTILVLTTNVSEENLDVFTQMEFALTVLPPSKKPPMVFVLFKDVFNSWVMDVKHAKALMSLFQVDAHILTVFKCQVESVQPVLMDMLSVEMVFATKLSHSAKLIVWTANVLNAHSDIILTSPPLMQSAENKSSDATTLMVNACLAELHLIMFLKPNHAKSMDALLISLEAAHNALPTMILDTTHANCQIVLFHTKDIAHNVILITL